MAASDNPLLRAARDEDPTLFATAYRKGRFYLFTTRSPDVHGPDVDRDIFNEKPSRDEKTVSQLAKVNKRLKTEARMHTTLGDIQLELFPHIAPQAVENFVGLARQSYYDGLIFHRVIKKFMIQTGDPLGDGTGGESLWHAPFQDEIDTSLARFDQPYMLAMANAGPHTNGSQFFITTVPCPWLDGKHTIFGKVKAGFDVCHEIENTPVSKDDKPLRDISIVNIVT